MMSWASVYIFFHSLAAGADAGIWEFICIMKNLKAVQMAGVGTVTLKQEHIVF